MGPNRCRLSDQYIVCCRARNSRLSPQIPKKNKKNRRRTGGLAFKSFLFLLEMDHISTQAVFSFTFNVPCIQNQNQSVHLLVPNKVYICKGLISKSFSCAINIHRYMYIQISQPQMSSILAKETNIKRKKLQKISNETIYFSFKI